MAHGFGNFYALSSSPAPEVVAWVNRMKGRPVCQVGSAVTTPLRMPRLFDWEALPAGLTPALVFDLMKHLLALGPFGFRGPAAAHVPEHLAAREGAPPTSSRSTATFTGRCRQQVRATATPMIAASGRARQK